MLNEGTRLLPTYSSPKQLFKKIIQTSPFAIPYSSIRKVDEAFGLELAGQNGSDSDSSNDGSDMPMMTATFTGQEQVPLMRWLGARFINFLMVVPATTASFTVGYAVANMTPFSEYTPEYYAVQAAATAAGCLVTKDIIIKYFYEYTEKLRAPIDFGGALEKNQFRPGQISSNTFDAIRNVFINFIMVFSFEPINVYLKQYYSTIGLSAFATGIFITCICLAIFIAFEWMLRRVKNLKNYPNLREIRDENLMETFTTDSLSILSITTSMALLSFSDINLFDSTHRSAIQWAIVTAFSTSIGHFAGTISKAFPFCVDNIVSGCLNAMTKFQQLARNSSCTIL